MEFIFGDPIYWDNDIPTVSYAFPLKEMYGYVNIFNEVKSENNTSAVAFELQPPIE